MTIDNIVIRVIDSCVRDPSARVGCSVFRCGGMLQNALKEAEEADFSQMTRLMRSTDVLTVWETATACYFYTKWPSSCWRVNRSSLVLWIQQVSKVWTACLRWFLCFCSFDPSALSLVTPYYSQGTQITAVVHIRELEKKQKNISNWSRWSVNTLLALFDDSILMYLEMIWPTKLQILLSRPLNEQQLKQRGTEGN